MTDIVISEGEMLTTTKRGKTVGVIYYRDLTGKSRRVFTKACPKAWARRQRELRDELVAGKHNANRMTFAQVAAEALADKGRLVGKKIRPQTFDNDERHLRRHVIPLLGDIPMAKLTVGDINGFIREKEVDDTSPKSIRNILSSINMVCKYALDKGYCQMNPSNKNNRQKVEGEQKERGGYHADEITALLDQKITPYLRTLITFVSLTGLSANELQGLLWSEVKLNQAIVHVCRNGYRGALQDTKTKYRVRDVPMPAKLVNIMREWKLQCPSEHFVFPSAKNKMADQKHWSGLLETLCKRAGVENKGIGGFRKFYHTDMENDGVPESIRKYRMGHSKKSNTAKVHYTVTDVRKAVDASDVERTAGKLGI